MKDEDGQMIAEYTHTPGGKLKEIRHGNGMHTLYEYDTDDNIIRLRLEKRDGETVSDFRYEYDFNGNRTEKTGIRLVFGDEKQKDTLIKYRYDSMNRLVEEQYDAEAAGYIYDLCGNRLEKLGIDGTEVYCYNKKNQLVSREKGIERDAYRYDLQGNVLEATGTDGVTGYSYNAFKRREIEFSILSW